MSDLLRPVEKLREEALQAFAAADTPDALESTRVEFLSRKGRLKTLQKELFQQASTPDEKKAVGAAFNPAQHAIQEAFEARKQALAAVSTPAASSGPQPDLTRPGLRPARGSLHPLTQTIRDVSAIFRSMGFTIEDGPEIEDSFHSFDALNIPEGHLARDPSDNFVLGNDRTFRSQTSTVQIRVMETQAPPIRCIVPGRVYRPDTVDATHHFMFHQIEGLVVAEGITFQDLKFALQQFLEAYYAGQNFEWRLRPHFFPFTECSAEVDVRMIDADGTRGRWLEMLGCGMVDPNVFRAVGIDPEQYTGFAFGMGVERLTMLRYAIPDIRHFFENDLRFLEQFA